MVKENQPTSALRRGFRLGKLGLTLTGSYLGYQAQNIFLGEAEKTQRREEFQRNASRRVRKELENLKGPIMKLGQILSTQSHAVPEEMIAELANLQMRAPGMHPTLARVQFKAACGKYPEEVFREFEREAFAAASLGQVHRAVTKRGDRVAVKIQYPAIRQAIENDFKLLRSATLPGRITGHAPVSVLNEIERGMLEETDYAREAENLDFFRAGLARLPYVTIPKPHRDLSTDRVLTMSFIGGLEAGKFLAGKPSQELRDLIGARLLELYYVQIHFLNALHADHHPGNYLFGPDGQIGLVDFGCVKRLSFDVVELSRCCIERAWSQGRDEAERVMRIIWGREVPFKKGRQMLACVEEATDVLFPRAATQAGLMVNFGEPKLLKLFTRNLTQAVRSKLTNPEFAFLSRAELGLYSLLHQLRARVNATEIWQRVTDPPGPGRG